jgi:hypothetical protein
MLEIGEKVKTLVTRRYSGQQQLGVNSAWRGAIIKPNTEAVVRRIVDEGCYVTCTKSGKLLIFYRFDELQSVV